MSSGQLTFIVLGLGIGGLFTAIGIHSLVVNLRLKRAGVRTEAIVAGHQTSESYDEKTRRTTIFHHPILEFTDQDGRAQRIVLDEASDRIEYAESYPVKIVYLPGNPPTVRIDTFSGRWLWVVLPLTIGLALLCATAAVWIRDIPVRMN